MDIKLKISSIIPLRIEDGPGVRTTVFFQGCSVKCHGCHNEETTWEEKEGDKLSIDDILTKLSSYNNPNKRITISGGEPLEQKEALVELLDRLNKEDYDIALYTSYDLTEISYDIRKRLNYIKVGRFIKNKKVKNKFYGSSNQRFIYLKKGEIVHEE